MNQLESDNKSLLADTTRLKSDVDSSRSELDTLRASMAASASNIRDLEDENSSLRKKVSRVSAHRLAYCIVCCLVLRGRLFVCLLVLCSCLFIVDEEGKRKAE